MNRLQKRAWIELAATSASLVVAAIGTSIMVKYNAKGFIHMITVLVTFGVVGLFGCMHEIRSFRKYDERERKIYQLAFMMSCGVFVVFLESCTFIIFFAIGGKGVIPVYILLVLFFAGLFVAQLVQSATILIKCAMEENDG